MAKYTELLIDYLVNNSLPSIFNDIDGFTDLFVAKYCDYEIGFETETLFKIKLEGKAKIVIPIYKQRIESLNTALNNILTTTKTRQTTVNAGEQAQQQYVLPFNVGDVEPSQTAHSDAYTNEDTVVESGATIDENLRVIDELNKNYDLLLESLLLEFKSLFMSIY